MKKDASYFYFWSKLPFKNKQLYFSVHVGAGWGVGENVLPFFSYARYTCDIAFPSLRSPPLSEDLDPHSYLLDIIIYMLYFLFQGLKMKCAISIAAIAYLQQFRLDPTLKYFSTYWQ